MILLIHGVDNHYVSKGMLVKLFIWIKGIIIHNGKWKLDLIILQVKIYDEIMPNICMIDEDESNPIDEQQYKKYWKMLDVGVNIEAVKQKCTIDGLDPSILNNKRPTNLIINKNSIPKKNNFSLLMKDLNSSKLKLNKTKIVKREIKKSNNGFQPTLEDILNIKNKLRSTNVKVNN